MTADHDIVEGRRSRKERREGTEDQGRLVGRSVGRSVCRRPDSNPGEKERERERDCCCPPCSLLAPLPASPRPHSLHGVTANFTLRIKILERSIPPTAALPAATKILDQIIDSDRGCKLAKSSRLVRVFRIRRPFGLGSTD